MRSLVRPVYRVLLLIPLLAGCGGGPQGYTPPSPATPIPATAAPATATPVATSSAVATPTTAPTKAGATATPIAAQPMPTIGASSPPPAMTAPPATSSPTPSATVSPVTLPAGEKIYVVNHGVQGDSPSVTIYPVAAVAASTPIATLAGSNTNLQQPYFDAVDANGTLYVSNQSNAPGNANAGYVTEYAAMGQSGNQPPVRTITGLDSPEGVAVDSAGNLYVAELYQINVYAPGASGNATPTRVIAGANTDLSNYTGVPSGLFVDATGNLIVAVGAEILEFAPGATGNVAPTTMVGESAATAGTADGGIVLASCLSAIDDAGGDIYGVNFNNDTFAYFPAGSPTGVPIQAPTSGMPFGMFADTAGEVFVTNSSTNTLFLFSSTTTFMTGVPTTTVSGTTSALNTPYGVTAR